MVVFKKNNVRLGIILGLVGPIISFFGYYLIKFRLFSLGEFMNALRTNKPLLTGLTVPCLLLNIVLFTIYVNTHRDETAKGIFAITLIYAIASLLFKFVG
jgi:hypothetical protein